MNKSFLYISCLLGILFLIGEPIVWGQSSGSVERVAEQRLQQSINKLAALRESIRKEQVPLVSELNQQEAALKEQNKKWETLQKIQRTNATELENLRKRVKAQQSEVDFVTRTLLPEFRANFDASLNAGERGGIGKKLQEINLSLEYQGATVQEKLVQNDLLFTLSLDHLKKRIGGHLYKGKGLVRDGEWVSGTFLQVGPLLYFSDGVDHGMVQETQSLLPEVVSLPEKLSAEIPKITQLGQGLLPIDSTLGDALSLEKTNETLIEHLRKGGIWIYPILGFALIATLIALGKLVQILLLRRPNPEVVTSIVETFLKKGKKEAQAQAQAQPQPARTVLVDAVQNADCSPEIVEEVMYQSLLSVKPKLEKFLHIIALTAATSPLLGLLGTVSGIIKTFKLMSIHGAGDPKPLISGISEALITTEIGLVLAIPALIIHALLSRKISGTLSNLEKMSIAFTHALTGSTKPNAKG